MVARSLWIKLMGIFLAVILVVIGLIVFLIGRSTTGLFELYVTQSGQQWATRLAPALSDYYAQTGSWEGVDSVLNTPWASSDPSAGRMLGQGWMSGMVDEEGGWGMGMEGGSWGMQDDAGWQSEMMDDMWGSFGGRLILVDADLVVVADTADALVGSRLLSEDGARGVPITSQGQTVGTLIATHYDTPATPAGEFLGAVRRAAIWSGIAGLALALGLGSVLFFQIMRPLRSLSAAAQGIAEGDLSQRAWVGAQDDIGHVAATFNQMADRLQQYAGERQRTIADIAHELRTPLSVIQSNLEAMLDGVLPTVPEELELLHQETLLLNRLITDLRTLSLAEAGQLRLEKQEVDPGMLVQQVHERMRLRAEEKGMLMETNIASDLPKIQADPERLMQVVTNLVDNALRYTPTGTQVTISAERAGQGVAVTVADTGPGIPAEDLPHVFDRFWRAEKSRNRSTGGSGLGLAIVRQLAEAHGGSAQAESAVGQGTRFTVVLPA